MQAVRKLLFFRLRGGIRHRLRELGSFKGVLYVALIVCFVLLIWHSFSIAQLMDPATASDLTRQFLPAGLLLGCMLSALISSGPALYFSEAEQNILFSAPVRRNNLALYKISSYASSAALSSLLLAALLPPVLGLSTLTFLSTLLTLLFIQLLSATISLGLTLCKKNRLCYTMALRLSVILVAVIIIWFVYSFSTNPAPVLSHLSVFVSLDIVRLMLTPFKLVSELHFAASYVQFASLATGAVTIITILVLSIVFLDKRLVEESLSQSRAAQEKWQRILSTGVIWKSNAGNHDSRKVPARFGGFGPLAWQQLQRAVRTSSNTVASLLLLGAACGLLFSTDAFSMTQTTRAAALYFIAVFIFPRFIVFDFRTSRDAMQYLKTLPVAPAVICLSQVAVPIALTTAIEWLMLLTATPFVDFSNGVVALAIPTILLFNLVLYLIENIFYLLYPTRLVPVGRVDFDFLGRTLGEFLLKSIVLATVFGLAVSLAIKVGSGSLMQNMFFTLTLLTVPVLFCVALLYILTKAYQRFDITSVAD